MGLLGSISKLAGQAFGSDAVTEGAKAGREDMYGYYQQARTDLTPYRDLGNYGITSLKDLMAKPDAITETPYYKFQLDQGLASLERGALAKGKLFSGQAAQDTIKYAQGLASTSYADEYARRFNLANLGLNASTATANAAIGTGTAMLNSQQTQGQDVASLNAFGMKQFGQAAATYASGGFGGGTLFK